MYKNGILKPRRVIENFSMENYIWFIRDKPEEPGSKRLYFREHQKDINMTIAKI
jgi:hypothetical protein